MNTPLTKQDLLELAMNHVGQELHNLGFEIIEINYANNKQPQFVCKDNYEQQYYVVVKAVKLPLDPYKYNVVWMESFKQYAYKQNAKVLYAGVGLGNAEDENLPVYHDQDYLLKYTGVRSVVWMLN
jgi:NADPH-dependent curcumin reductase CurA